jgi:hypothetical protein
MRRIGRDPSLRMSVVIALGLLNVAARAQGPVTIVPPLPGQAADANPAERLSAPVPTRFTSKIGFFGSDPALGAGYPRVIELRTFPAGRGHLLATFTRKGALPVFLSTDGGETWQHVSDLPALHGEPALLELPRRVGRFAAGTVLMAGSSTTDPSPDPRKLLLYASEDGGRSWAFVSTIAESPPGLYNAINRAGLSNQSPVYEPFLHLDARNRLVASYSNEGFKAQGYSQLLEHKVSSDGGYSWGPAVRDVAIADGLTRPGMPVVARAADGTFFMSYEVVGKPGVALEPRSNPAHLRTSRDGSNWGDPGGYGTFIQDRWRQYANGTPYLIWSPWGGPKGTLIVSARSVLRYEIGRVGNGMLVNRNGGEGLWTLIETPIVYNPATDGYSQTMIALGDGREILQLVPVSGRLAYAKFELPAELPTTPFAGGFTEPRPPR